MRILHLPYLCILEIIENWNLFELYNFSLLSKRARVLVKLKKFPTPEKAIIRTRHGFRFTLEFPDHIQRSFRFTKIEEWSDNHLDDPCRKNFTHSQTRFFFFQNPVQGGFQFTDFLIHLFNVSVTEIFFYISEANNPKDLESTIEWINNQKNLEIMEATVFGPANGLLPMVLQKYQKKTKAFHIRVSFVNGKPDPSIIFSPSLELDSLYISPFADNVHGMSLDFLLSSNFPKIDMGGQSMTCQDINTFLNSWKNGKTNSKLKSCELRMRGRIDIKAIFKGLKPIVHDPKTTKTIHRVEDSIRCSYSGIDIQRIDGKRAKFHLQTYWLKEGKDAEIHQEVVDEYQDSKESKEDKERKDGSSKDREWYIRIEIY